MPVKPTPPSCPRCSNSMRLRNGRNGQFWGCSQYSSGRCSATLPFIAPIHDEYTCPIGVKRISQPSEYQEAIFDELENGSRHLVVNAVAGSGKTSTCVEGLIRKYSGGYSGRAIFMAFNTAIRDEIENRVKDAGLSRWVDVRTLHSLGYSACRRKFGSELYDKKVDDILDAMGIIARRDDGTRNEGAALLRSETKEAVSLMKNTLLPLGEAAAQYAKNWSSERLPATVEAVMTACRENTAQIDFDDMVWLAAVSDVPLPPADLIMVDEVQDLNAAQHAFLSKIIYRNAGARVMSVGDPRQSIYGFRGAMADSMLRLTGILTEASAGCVELPLSVTYRCPRSHVALAQQLVPHIKPAPGAAEGFIGYVSAASCSDKMTAGDLVVCRTNAPLVSVAYALLKRGQKAIIKGRDFGAAVRALVKRLKAKTISSLIKKLGDYRQRESERLQDKEDALQALYDTCETITMLAEGHATIKSMLDFIEELFTDVDETKAVVLSTVHRAKGLEADTVYILNYDRIELPSRTDWGQTQERNLHYVAVTRAKRNLMLITKNVPEELAG